MVDFDRRRRCSGGRRWPWCSPAWAATARPNAGDSRSRRTGAHSGSRVGDDLRHAAGGPPTGGRRSRGAAVRDRDVHSSSWSTRCAMFRDGAERFLVFGIGAERFAVPLSAVDEVIDAPSVQRIPDSPRHGARCDGDSRIVGDGLRSASAAQRRRAAVNDAALLFERRGAGQTTRIGASGWRSMRCTTRSSSSRPT